MRNLRDLEEMITQGKALGEGVTQLLKDLNIQNPTQEQLLGAYLLVFASQALSKI
jgi:hypothetical protein